jgi:hypothetical protein
MSLSPFRYEPDDSGLIDCFVDNGFVIIKSAVPTETVDKLHSFVSKRYCEEKKTFLNRGPENNPPVLGISRKIVEAVQSTSLYPELTQANRLLDSCEQIIGPDLSLVKWLNLWINDPEDPSIVTNKSLHQEAWSGQSVDELTVWVPLHEPDNDNSMSVIPQSHYFGLMPNRNRNLVIPSDFEVPKELILTLEKGEAVLFHALLLHKTTGRGKNMRFACSFTIRNTLAQLGVSTSYQGFFPVRRSAFTRIRKTLGNDYLTPLRTYGGKSSNKEILDY